MAITTYSELQVAVDAWADQGGALDAYLGDFVTLATQMFNFGSEQLSPIRTRDMLTVASLTSASGVCTLPTDYLHYRRVVEDASLRRELTYITPSVSEQTYPSRTSGLACEFTIIGSSLYTFPLSENDIELTYFQQIPDLTDAAPTNWLLTKHPALYLHGTLFQLALFRRDDDLAQRSAGLITSMVTGLSNTDLLANYAYAPTRPRMTVV